MTRGHGPGRPAAWRGTGPVGQARGRAAECCHLGTETATNAGLLPDGPELPHVPREARGTAPLPQSSGGPPARPTGGDDGTLPAVGAPRDGLGGRSSAFCTSGAPAGW